MTTIFMSGRAVWSRIRHRVMRSFAACDTFGVSGNSRDPALRMASSRRMLSWLMLCAKGRRPKSI